jgi:hypothetical protein
MKALLIFNTILVGTLLVFTTLFSFAQTAPPEADIYLVDLKVKKNKVQLSNPKNVTNREGYDNQPNFTPDGRGFLYTSMRESQTDIYFYDLKSNSSKPMTSTPESEYSAAVTPTGRHFSTVRVEKDGTQRLWQFEMTNPQNASLVLENLKPVGYYVWANANQLALFVLGEPNSLYTATFDDGKSQKVENNVGRSFHKIPKRKNTISFIHKATEKQWLVKSLEMQNFQMNTLIETLEGCEDICWTKNGILLISKGSKLYQWHSQADKTWIEVADFSNLGVKQITRIAVNPKGNLLTFVGAK